MSFRPKTILDLINYSSGPPTLLSIFRNPDEGPRCTCTFCGADICLWSEELEDDEQPMWADFLWCKECHRITRGENCCRQDIKSMQDYPCSIFRVAIESSNSRGFPIVPPTIVAEFFSYMKGEGAKEFVTYCGCDGHCVNWVGERRPFSECCKRKTRLVGLFWEKKLPLDLVREYYPLFLGN